MSYCRFSSLDFKCDVYAYGGGPQGRITVHVAEFRYAGDIPPLYEIQTEGDANERRRWQRSQRAQLDAIRTATLHKIGGVYDGQTFHVMPDEFPPLLETLREAGYVFPLSLLEDDEA
jgi:hypothetical protein